MSIKASDLEEAFKLREEFRRLSRLSGVDIERVHIKFKLEATPNMLDPLGQGSNSIALEGEETRIIASDIGRWLGSQLQELRLRAIRLGLDLDEEERRFRQERLERAAAEARKLADAEVDPTLPEGVELPAPPVSVREEGN